MREIRRRCNRQGLNLDRLSGGPKTPQSVSWLGSPMGPTSADGKQRDEANDVVSEIARVVRDNYLQLIAVDPSRGLLPSSGA